MTCKYCVHYAVCKFVEPCQLDVKCNHFKDKSNFIELPFVAMVDRFIKNGKFDSKRTAHNGKYAVVYVDETKWGCPLIEITEQFYGGEKALERIQALKVGADNG